MPTKTKQTHPTPKVTRPVHLNLHLYPHNSDTSPDSDSIIYFTVRLPRNVKVALEEIAKELETSLSDLIQRILLNYVILYKQAKAEAEV